MHPSDHLSNNRRILRWWAIFLLACILYAAGQWGVRWAGILYEADSAKREAIRGELYARLEHIPRNSDITDLEHAYNQGRPLARQQITSRIQRVVLDAQNLDSLYQGWRVEFQYASITSSDPRDQMLYEYLVRAPRPNPSFAVSYGAPHVRIMADQIRRVALIFSACAWFISMVLIPSAGRGWRRKLARISLAAVFFSLVTWGAEPEMATLRELPRSDWILATILSCGLISLVALLIPPRKPFPAGRCAACGYNLTGNLSGVCPECGTPTPDETRRRRDAELIALVDAMSHVRLGNISGAQEAETGLL